MFTQKNVFIIVSLIITHIFSYCCEGTRYDKQQYAYLSSPIFQQRQKLAVEWAHDCFVLIDIGGGKDSVSAYVSNEQKVFVIDPAIKEKKGDQVICIAKKFEDWTIEEHIKTQKYAVIILGLALDGMSSGGWNKLHDLIDGSEVAVIEYSARFRHAKKQFKTIVKSSNKKVVEKREFDFSQADELQASKYKTDLHAFERVMFLLK